MTALLVVSGLLELVGLVCAGIGFRATWSEHARGEEFIEPMLRPVKSWARAAENRVRKLLRRPGKTIDLQVHDVIQMQESAVVDLTQAWGPPPDPTIDLPAYADVVTRRINHLHEKVQTQQHDLAAEVEARGTAIRQAQNALTAEVDEVRKLSRQVAVGGLRLQVVGWLFLLAGIVVGTIANIVGS